ncbi:putative baseplate assembly protein [uncultured Serinicoccus sp.]|uniref:putative baseplate assembly protein n=1 Tax=uncultured Serinicoccus sp. TaxID=735514 RepID=UPI0026276F0C|nr:putative baseplate assembly protein [uncultured Serinicoccus sp.]
MTADLPLLADVDREARRSLIRGRSDIDGIDRVEVLSNHVGRPGHVAGAPAQRTLVVHLVNGPVPVGWGAGEVRVLGGVREDPALNPVEVLWAHGALSIAGASGQPPVALPEVTAADRDLVAATVPEERRGAAFVLRTSSSGDFSTYQVRLLGPGSGSAPPGIDVPLSVSPVRFTVDCPADDDCALPAAMVPVVDDLLPGDYLARDYEALRMRLLDRLSTVLPEWTDRSPADPGVMMVELFASVGDRLASWQDAVAAEAYLSTARRRTSVRRHARLLAYQMHEGCSARTLLSFSVPHALTVPAGVAVTDLPPAADVTDAADAAEVGGTVFETAAAATLRPSRNAMPLHAWGDPDHRLEPGTTAAYVVTAVGTDPGLVAGDLLVLAERPVGGDVSQGDPNRRHPVRLTSDPHRHDDVLEPGLWVWELRWSVADALAGPLQVTLPGAAQPVAVALGNIVPADDGATVARRPLIPPTVGMGAYRPRVSHPTIASIDRTYPADAPAAELLQPDPRAALPWLELDDGEHTWTPRQDLLASGRLDTHLVVEPEPGGVARVRFGDGVTGRQPTRGTTFAASYRRGGGRRGNLAADRLVRHLAAPDGTDPFGGLSVQVWNPLPATGGTDPEPMEDVVQLAPAAFRTQLRAVTSPDYAVVAEQHPGVQRAVARRRWSGSWYTQAVTLDRVAAYGDGPTVAQEVAAALEVRRMAGIDVTLERPLMVALSIALTACLHRDTPHAPTEVALRRVFTSGLHEDGTPGFFHVDRFTFGQQVRLSGVVAAAMGVPGIAWVEVTAFSRATATPSAAAQTLAAGVIEAGSREVLRCDSDPSNPEHGRLELTVRGGT